MDKLMINKIFSLRIYLNHPEFEEEVINSLISEQILLVECRSYSHQNFLLYSAIRSWLNSLKDAIGDFESEGVVLGV